MLVGASRCQQRRRSSGGEVFGMMVRGWWQVWRSDNPAMIPFIIVRKKTLNFQNCAKFTNEAQDIYCLGGDAYEISMQMLVHVGAGKWRRRGCGDEDEEALGFESGVGGQSAVVTTW
ncbi:hypothetical protein O988_07712 [Pseudogymnoascus sp. VKM F-3808]|nr:hypothetical protein O988_07712 [Pseudogymnoascus sp. VKM F-3808]